MKAKSIIFATLALLLSTSCNGQNEQEVKQEKQNTMSKSIVIFFSHAGDNYAVGNIEIGNTKIVADYISEITGADQFEIVIPFTTHEGSGLASCVSDVKREFPKAKVTQGFSIHGHEVRTNRAKVEKWLKGLGY